MLGQEEFFLRTEVETMVAGQAGLVEIGQQEVNILIGGDIIIANINGIVVRIVGLSLRERESGTEVPTGIDFPRTAFAESVGSHQVDVVAAIEVRIISDFAVITLHPSQRIDKPQVNTFVLVFYGYITTV